LTVSVIDTKFVFTSISQVETQSCDRIERVGMILGKRILRWYKFRCYRGAVIHGKLNGDEVSLNLDEFIFKREIRFHIDRYLKKNKLPLTGSYIEIKPLYFPYWKIDAVVLKVRNKKFERFAGTTDDQGRDLSYEQEVSDIKLAPYTSTVSANADFPFIPHSIGMRTEYIRLDTFATQNVDDEFLCIPATKSWDRTLEDLEKTIKAIDKVNIADFGKNLTELFHPRGSMVYYPYYFVESDYKGVNRQFILDGKFGTVLRYDEKPFFDIAVNLGWHLALRESMSIAGLCPPFERQPMMRLAPADRRKLEAITGKITAFGETCAASGSAAQQ